MYSQWRAKGVRGVRMSNRVIPSSSSSSSTTYFAYHEHSHRHYVIWVVGAVTYCYCLESERYYSSDAEPGYSCSTYTEWLDNEWILSECWVP